MKKTSTQNRKLTVLAIPYYSQLVRHNGGLEHIYFKLMADPVTGEFSKAKLCVWDQKVLPSLPDWLAHEGIEALLCSDNRPGFEGIFAATGITIFWDQRGEVKDMVAQWTDRLAMGNHWDRAAYA